jgi:hypothetical protein
VTFCNEFNARVHFREVPLQIRLSHGDRPSAGVIALPNDLFSPSLRYRPWLALALLLIALQKENIAGRY